jgi:hypothetical protein
MIIAGKTRGAGGQLAEYLLEAEKNDRVEVIETRGFEPGALIDQLEGAEAETLADTRAKAAFYFTAFRPDEGETLTRKQYLWGVNRLEERLGLQTCPRVIVSQTYKGEEHWHVAWNHYDRETGKMAPLKFDARVRQEVGAEMEERFGLRRLDRGLEYEGHARQAEDAQSARSAQPKRERVAEITALWEQTDSGKALAAGLEAAGYRLATGKSRAFCVVDANGEVHSLARQIKGAKAAEVAARLADIDPQTLPTAEEVKAEARAARRDAEAAAKTSEDKPRSTRAERKAAREAERAADQDQIAAADTAHVDDPGLKVTTPRERTEAEAQAAAGMAEAILSRITARHSTFTEAELEREVAKMTGHVVRESWIASTGGVGELSKDQRAAAERAYERWAGERPHAAARYSLADYVDYAQGREAERVGDPDTIQARADRRDAFRATLDHLKASGEIVDVGADPANPSRHRFTTRDMAGVELDMEGAAQRLAMASGHGITPQAREPALERAAARQGFKLAPEQLAAVERCTGGEGLALIVGYAGAGKSATMNSVREVYEAEGYRVRGAALSNLAAQGLQDSAGIASTSLDRLLHRLDGQGEREAKIAAQTAKLEAKLAAVKGGSDRARRYREDIAGKLGSLKGEAEAHRLTPRDVIALDEAAMVDSRKLGRLLAHAAKAGAKVIALGDQIQLQAIEAGAGFRALHDRHGAAELKDVRRQEETWQRDATKGFRDGRAQEALSGYRDHGMTHESGTREAAKAELVSAWAAHRAEHPERSAIILTALNVDVNGLNAMAREAYGAQGRLGEDHAIPVKDGTVNMAEGDRFLFKKNDSQMGVMNGSLGTVRRIEGDQITVALDDAKGREGRGASVTFSAAEYDSFSHGYAYTVHKTQGVTVDRAFVLATPFMDRHSAYVAMSRHRERADLYHGRDDFRSYEAMASRVSRDGSKDSVLDYLTRAARSEGEPMPASFRQTVTAVWGRVCDLFGLRDRHPAEAAELQRDAARKPADQRRADQPTTTKPAQPRDSRPQDLKDLHGRSTASEQAAVAERLEAERRRVAEELAEARRQGIKPGGITR